jgi:hypothetical protein
VESKAKCEISLHADQHGQSSVDVRRLRTMEGGRRAKDANDGNEKKSVGAGASLHVDQHG